MGASESTDRSGRDSNSTEDENASNGGGSTASKILAGVAVGALAVGAYALSSASSSISESPNHNSQPFSSSSQPPPSSSGSLPGNHNKAKNQTEEESWKPPEKNWIKCNVDGFCRGGSAGCGGVFRDDSGTWILGFSRKLDLCDDNTEAELCGIIAGLSIAWKYGFRCVTVETDSLSSRNMIENGCKKNSRCYDLIQQIKSLRERSWNVKIVHCYREPANRVANMMAGYSRKLEAETQEFDDPPSKEIKKLYEDDLAGVSRSGSFAIML